MSEMSNLSEDLLRKQFNQMYDGITRGIKQDLNDDRCDFFSKNTWSILRAEFRDLLGRINERYVIELPYRKNAGNADKFSELKAEFYNKTIDFIEDYIGKISLWAEDALTSEEMYHCFFTPSNYNKKELAIVYENLVAEQWISNEITFDEFLYFFSGEGNPPFKQIVWLRDSTWLTLFLNQVVQDKKVWAKAAKIFVHKDADNGEIVSYSRKTLSVASNRMKDTAYLFTQVLKALNSKILPPK